MTNSDTLHVESTPMGWTAYYDPEGLHGDGVTPLGALEDLLDQTDEAWRKALDEGDEASAAAKRWYIAASPYATPTALMEALGSISEAVQNIEAGDATIAAIKEANVQLQRERDMAQSCFAEARYRPMGDNHHNAVACPYCNPKREVFAPADVVHYAEQFKREAEVYAAERDMAQAHRDRCVDILTRIYAKLGAESFTRDGVTYTFEPKDKAFYWPVYNALCAEIRAIPDELTKAAVAALSKNTQRDRSSTAERCPLGGEDAGSSPAGSTTSPLGVGNPDFDAWWSGWVGSDGDGYDMDVHKRHARAAWKAATAVPSQGNPS